MGRAIKMKWADVKKQIDGINDHYSMIEPQHKILFEYAMKVPKGGIVLELGVCHGKTAALFALIGKSRGFDYFGIDDFSLEGSTAEVQGHFDRLGVKGTIIESRTQDTDWYQQIDLLFIDSGHDEANVAPDCEKYIPLVKPGGVVIFDDWPQLPGREDPHWAVAQYGLAATRGWESLNDENYVRAFRRLS